MSLSKGGFLFYPELAEELTIILKYANIYLVFLKWEAKMIQCLVALSWLLVFPICGKAEMQKTEIFTVHVNYGFNAKFLIKISPFEYINPEVYSKNFTLTKTGKTEIKIQLVRFDKPMFINEIMKELEKANLRPANYFELLSLFIRHQNFFEKEFAEYNQDSVNIPQVVALGTIWRPQNSIYTDVICIRMFWDNKNPRKPIFLSELDTDCLELVWIKDWFVVVIDEKELETPELLPKPLNEDIR